MPIDPHTFRRLCRARDLLRGTPALAVHEVADRVAISRFHFIRRFATVFGATPNRFRTAWRIERAKELLARGELSVTEVCLEVGFSSLGSFSSLFRERVGTTPSAYRREMRALASEPGELPAEMTPGCLSLMGRVDPAVFRNSR